MTELHYRQFDVLAEKDQWDDVSRSVVMERLHPRKPAFLNEKEIATLRAIASNLLYESRDDVLQFVVSHIDQQLASPIGEGDRKPDAPPQADLVRRGLAALEAAATSLDGQPFDRQKPEIQAKILQDLQLNALSMPNDFADVPQKDLFKKLLSLSVDAWVSHPAVWSEMGYAGPAFPRGYYRIERGLTDPWEAQTNTPQKQGEDDAAQ